MKKILVLLMVCMLLALTFIGCEDQADVVSHNLSKEADNFNVVREVTLISGIQGDVIFQMTGRLSIANKGDQLEVVVEYEKGKYAKHFFFKGDNDILMVEQKGYADINQYKYTLNYNPKMWLPVELKVVD